MPTSTRDRRGNRLPPRRAAPASPSPRANAAPISRGRGPAERRRRHAVERALPVHGVDPRGQCAGGTEGLPAPSRPEPDQDDYPVVVTREGAATPSMRAAQPPRRRTRPASDRGAENDMLHNAYASGSAIDTTRTTAGVGAAVGLEQRPARAGGDGRGRRPHRRVAADGSPGRRRDRREIKIVLFLLATTLLVSGVAGIAPQLRGRGVVLGRVGAVLAVPGLVAFAGLVTTWLYDVGLARTLPPVDAAEVTTAAGATGAAAVVLLVGCSASPWAWLFTAGLWRAGVASVWSRSSCSPPSPSSRWSWPARRGGGRPAPVRRPGPLCLTSSADPVRASRPGTCRGASSPGVASPHGAVRAPDEGAQTWVTSPRDNR